MASKMATLNILKRALKQCVSSKYSWKISIITSDALKIVLNRICLCAFVIDCPGEIIVYLIKKTATKGLKMAIFESEIFRFFPILHQTEWTSFCILSYSP